MYLRDTLKHVLDAIVVATGSRGLDADEFLVRAYLTLYEEDPRSLSRYPGRTIRRKVEKIPLSHFTAGEGWSQARCESVWSVIETHIEAALRESRALHTARITPVIVRDRSVQPDWQETTSVGQLVRHAQWILEHSTIVELRGDALPTDELQILMHKRPRQDEMSDSILFQLYGFEELPG